MIRVNFSCSVVAITLIPLSSTFKALSTTTDFVKSELRKFNTNYKRNKNYENDPLYVAPQDKAIGTRWEMVADKKNLSTFPKRIQSPFSYVSMIETIKSLFLREDFVRAYENHVNFPNHSCKEKEYHRFCCSNRFKTNEFFQNNPNSLQIQLATDEFEVCNPLGSKATLHKCCAIYLVFPNMPRTSNLKNIYLVCLCNGNDLKTKQTDFNDLWKVIVKEIKYLEEFGINVNDNLNVKCTLVNVSFDNLGANQSLGLAEGFNSNYYCRICECSKEDCQ